MEIKVSVLMMTYMHNSFIQPALFGVINQLCDFNVELIIADDCSRDDSSKTINNFLNNIEIPDNFHVSYKKNKKNIGMNANYIMAFNCARGKYIANCEGDDYWTDPLKLQKQVDFLEANPDYAIHSGNACYLNYKEGEKIYDDNESHTFDINDFITKNNLITLTVMFRKPNSLDINMLKNIVYGDWGLYVLILKENGYKALRSSEVFGVYRKHNGSLTKKMNAIDQMENMIAQILFNVRYLNYDKFEVFKKSMGELSLFKTSFSNKLKLLVFQMAFQLIINRLKAYIRI